MSKKLFIFSLLVMTFLSHSLFGRSRYTKTTIQSSPSGATVVINGGNFSNESFTTPTTQNLRNGLSFTLTFILNGYETKTVTITGGQRSSVQVTLVKPSSGNETTVERVDGDDNDRKRYVKASITSNPSGARVVVNGGNYQNEEFTTPVQLNFRDGLNYTLTFSKGGYKTKRYNFTGGMRNLHASLERDIAYYDLTIDSNVRGARVYIDGQNMGKTRTSLELEEGDYTLRVEMEGYDTYSQKVRLRKNESLYIELEEQRFIIFSLPAGAKLWIDGENVKLNFKNRSSSSFRIKGGSKKGANVRIQYYGLVIEEYIFFDKQTISLDLLLNSN